MTNNSANSARSYRANYGVNRSKNATSATLLHGNGFPLRIMVSSEYVGAIIGKKGQTIRNITTQCKARVDVHGKENSGLLEKIISIFGQPENVTNACKEILHVVEKEAVANNRGDVMLKMLTDDRYCGRIIGKEGKMIKKIRDDTGTKITVSNAQEMATLFPDRVIAIRGSVDGMAQAESAISAKLAECMEQELNQASMGGMMMMPLGVNTTYFPSRPYDAGAGFYPSVYMTGAGQTAQSGASGGGSNEVVQIAVPNAAVGAIIGTAGSNIKQMMRDSGAFMNIESKKDGEPAIERLVTIKGANDACWRASYMVFEKMQMEGFSGNDDVRLKTVIRIPKPVVGRIIGKAGKNVRELQRCSGAMIKLPEDPTVQGEEVAVELYGNFMAFQTAHMRIKSLVHHAQQTNFAAIGPAAGPAARGPRRPAASQQQLIEAQM